MRPLPVNDFIELLSACPETGEIRWKKTGKIAGCIGVAGYWLISYKKVLYPAHRVLWAIVHKADPVKPIDHINGVKTDNRLSNLRLTNPTLNTQNQRKATKTNRTSGLIGASFHKRTGKWQAAICVNGKDMHLGLFDNPMDAHLAYVEAKRKLHPACTI